MQNVDSVTVELIKGAIRLARKEIEALIGRTSMLPFIFYCDEPRAAAG
ncbi:MAG: hypothetical protein BMS9Abin01_2507 [Gammaproteobacteria bacterium]|nr:MAG: hypothetical protein BMS9Abin01_2507 [Gammaproteobacteria bacterium]